MEDDNNKATIASWHVLITATTEGVEISTLDDDGNRKQTIAFDGDKLKKNRCRR
jgi:hypothetical protein